MLSPARPAGFDALAALLYDAMRLAGSSVGRVADSFQALKDAKAFARAERDRTWTGDR